MISLSYLVIEKKIKIIIEPHTPSKAGSPNGDINFNNWKNTLETL